MSLMTQLTLTTMMTLFIFFSQLLFCHCLYDGMAIKQHWSLDGALKPLCWQADACGGESGNDFISSLWPTFKIMSKLVVYSTNTNVLLPPPIVSYSLHTQVVDCPTQLTLIFMILIFVFFSVSWQISNPQIWKNTAGKSARGCPTYGQNPQSSIWRAP